MKRNILPPYPAGCASAPHFCGQPCVRPDILLLDEPFGALDVITRGDMQDWLISMRARLNRTVLLVTHDMDEALYLSDRILILNQAPAHITCEIEIPDRVRNRDWLYNQGALRQKIHSEIMTGRV